MANQAVVDWLAISKALLCDLAPEASPSDFGQGMDRAAFARLVDDESDRVDRALVDMAIAADETAVRARFAQLGAEARVALLSRWAMYTAAWEKLRHDPAPQLWIPPTDTWRAVFLAMTSEGERSTAAARFLWTADF
jgi:hypothetical protein